MTPLPKPSIDTGMGLERIAAVVQGEGLELRHGSPRGRSSATSSALSRKALRRTTRSEDVSMRVIADHARAADVPHRRRRHARRTSGAGTCSGGSCAGPCATAACSASSEPFLWDVTGSVVGADGRRPTRRSSSAQPRVAETVRLEEERFAETLDLGMARIREYMSARVELAAARRAHRRRQVPVHALRHLRLPARPRPGGVPGRRLGGAAGEPRPSTRQRWRPSASARAPARSFGPAATRRRVTASASTSSSRPSCRSPSSSAIRSWPRRRGSWPWSTDGRGAAGRRARERPSRSSSTGRPRTPSPAARWATPASSPAAPGRGASRTRTTAAPSSSSTASA